MSSIKNLLQTAAGKGRRAEAAREELYQENLKIVPLLLREIRGSTGKELHLIRDILLRIGDPKIVLAVSGSLSSKDFDEWKIAFDVLSNPELKSAFDVLVAQLMDAKNLESKRDQAAAALGELANGRAI